MSPATLSQPKELRLAPNNWVRADFVPGSTKEQNGNLLVRLRVAAGAAVRRYGWFDGGLEEFDELLSFEPGAHRDQRLQSGRVPLADTHRTYSVLTILGKVFDPVWDRAAQTLEVVAMISARPELAGLRRDILDGIVANVSCGYSTFQVRDVTQRDSPRRQVLAIDWEITEVSFVPVPADPGASTRSAEPAQPTVLVSYSRSSMDTPAATTVPAQPAAPAAPAPAPAPTETRAAPPVAPAPAPAAAQPAPVTVDAGARERSRQTSIRQRLTRASLPTNDDFASSLLDHDVHEDLASSRILDRAAQAAAGPPIASQVTVTEEEGSKLARQCEDALWDRVGKRQMISLDPKEVGVRLQGNPFLRRRMLQVGELFLERAHKIPRERMLGLDQMRLAGAILQPRRQDDMLTREGGLHSTTDFPGILANITTKSLRAAYDLTPETYTAWTVRRTLPDFKQAKVIQIGTAPRLLPKREGAEYKRGTFGEQSEPIQLATYGRIVAMSREMMINDDLDAFARIPGSYGIVARQLIADLVYAHLIGNTVMADGFALFDATNHGNLITAGSNAFTSANAVVSLSNTRVLAREQKAIAAGDGEAAQFMNVGLVHLRVPEQLETVAQQIVSAIQPQQVSNVNPFQGVWVSVMAEPRLGAVSAAAYYAFGPPGLIDTIQVAFLDGEDGPVVDSRIGWDQDGLEYRVRMDVGTSPVDFRNMYKNNGAT